MIRTALINTTATRSRAKCNDFAVTRLSTATSLTQKHACSLRLWLVTKGAVSPSPSKKGAALLSGNLGVHVHASQTQIGIISGLLDRRKLS